MAIFKLGGDTWEERLLKEALIGKQSPSLSEGNIQEQMKIKRLVSLLNDEQKGDFLRVIERLKLDAKVIIEIKKAEELVQFYKVKAREVETILGIRPISEAELLTT